MTFTRAALLLAAVAFPVRGQATPLPRARVIAAAKEVMKTARYATLVTIGEGGEPQARVIDPRVPDPDMTIWVATNPLTRKVAEIRREPRVALLYFNAAAGEYVTVHGTATVVADSAERVRHWKAEWGPYYKNGPRGADYLLIRVRPTRLEVVSPRKGVASDAKTWRPVIINLP